MENKNTDIVEQEILKFLNELVAGNYSYKPKSKQFDGLHGEIFDAIFELRNKMLHYVFEMQVASSQVMSASDELTVAIDDNTEIMQQIYTEANDIQQLNLNSQNAILSSLDEFKQIANLMNEVKETSDQVKKSSEQSHVVLNNSMGEILEIVGAVESIKDSTDNTVSYIKKLKQSTSEISDILQKVNSISRKTHIISLNASIESARAGLSGRGFAVLTDEIRRLAAQSGEAVTQITDLVERITDEMVNVDIQMQKDLVNVQKSVDCTKKVEVSLERIEQTYDDVNKMVKTIVNATEEESKLAYGVKNSISEIEAISYEVTKGFEKVYDSVHRQKHTMEDISNLGTCLSNASNSLSILNEKTDVDLIDENSEKFLHISENVFKILQEELLALPKFALMQADVHKELLDDMIDNYKMVEAIWSNNKKGKFIYSNPPAGIANAKVRDWFKASINGNQFISELYISAITKNPCITVSLPIKDSNNEIIGVIGADLKLHI